MDRRFVIKAALTVVGIVGAQSLSAASLRALDAWHRPDPFGGIVKPDQQGGEWRSKMSVRAARGSYASFHLVAEGKGTLEVKVASPLQRDIYREWFHHNDVDGQYYPDALIPEHKEAIKLQEPTDNKIAGQKVQSYWVDIWVPTDAKPGTYVGQASLEGTDGKQSLPVQIVVTDASVPQDDALTIDHNSYGVEWLHTQYPKAFAATTDPLQKEAELIHAYHRVFYDHRGIFHQLGYSHLGSMADGFAPVLKGTGEKKEISDWSRFDALFGPLLDGTAFTNTRRGARPIPSVYLPVNAAWPANELWWGEPGYEAEFERILGQMEAHFKERGWTHTRFEMFFNQKKRYKGYGWDGDEVRFLKDDQVLKEYARMMRAAVPTGSPVRFELRLDSSWQIGEQIKDLSNDVRLWTVSQGMFSWYAKSLPELHRQGSTVWTYGGTPPVQQSSTMISMEPMRSWISGVDGYVRWLAVAPGKDPWFHLQGGDETLVYPGEIFGIEGPIPSIRLKLQRNALEDIALLKHAAARMGGSAVEEKAVHAYNGTSLASWRNTNTQPPAGAVIDWSNADIGDALRPFEARFQKVSASAWGGVHELAVATGGDR